MNIVSQEISISQHPWNKEDNLDIKEDKEHGRDVELDGELRMGLIVGDHSTLVCSVFGGISDSFFTKKMTNKEDDARD